jgi:two-component system sensor histidine kinase/response regulator
MDVLEISQEAGRPFQFVLLDAHIPDRDTFAFAAQIKGNPRTAAVKPVMLLSPSLRLADEIRARELGLEYTLVKPINANDLRELMERARGGLPTGESKPFPQKVVRNVLPVARWDVLLVDNSRFNQEVATGVFGQQGHRIAIARTSKEAVAILGRRSCDMVLIGLDIPGTDSLEILAAIREHEKNRQKPVKVFVMTSDRMIAEREPSLKEITDGFLPNPIQPKDLSLLLEQVKSELEQY